MCAALTRVYNLRIFLSVKQIPFRPLSIVKYIVYVPLFRLLLQDLDALDNQLSQQVCGTVSVQ